MNRRTWLRITVKKDLIDFMLRGIGGGEFDCQTIDSSIIIIK